MAKTDDPDYIKNLIERFKDDRRKAVERQRQQREAKKKD
jgi:hypothetical protein